MQTVKKSDIKLYNNDELDTPATMSPKSTSSSQESLTEELLQFEGSTTFAPSPSPVYRYSMTLKSGKLRIWLEDCDSKNQWCTAQLSLEDYVDSTNALLDATASDYVTYFHELLDGAHDGNADIPIKFKRHQEETFHLEVTVKFQVLRQSLAATYVFVLKPISLERIDVLEAKMRDLEEEMEQLREEREEVIEDHFIKYHALEGTVKVLQDDLVKYGDEILKLGNEVKALRVAQDNSETLQLQATTKMADLICWYNAIDGTVQMGLPGMYQVTVVVNYKAKSTNAAVIQLLKGSECIQTAYCGYTEGYCNTTSMTCITRVEQRDQFTVKCPVNLSGTSFLVFIRLGK